MPGPLEVRDGANRLIAPSRRKERVLLAVLLLRDGTPTSADALSDALWPEALPRSAGANLKTYLSDLRRLLRDGGAVIDTRPDGYVLRVDRDALDATRFEDLVAEGREALRDKRFDVATERLTRALGLWRGPALDGLPVPELVRPRVTVLEELRLAVQEDNVDARLALGQEAELCGELSALTGQHPLRERLWAQLMLARYRTGRQAEALAAYRSLREALAAELGIEPSPAVKRLHVEILRADRALDRAPLLPSAVVPRRPPAAVPDFTGRRAALRELDRQAVRARDDRAGATVVISAIAGTAGVGKTALAVYWADRARELFPDGQLYADLRGYGALPPRRPLEVLSRFLHALGVPPERVPPDLDEATALYRSTPADRAVLVVLDDAASADQVRPLLPGGSGCLVVVTSRDRMAAWWPGRARAASRWTCSRRPSRSSCRAGCSGRTAPRPSRRRPRSWPPCARTCRWRCASPPPTTRAAGSPTTSPSCAAATASPPCTPTRTPPCGPRSTCPTARCPRRHGGCSGWSASSPVGTSTSRRRRPRPTCPCRVLASC
ncbi:BTAD domain-containing putative transcriptional regulator [Actinosynnema sp. NPDC091369]